ncbi:MAG: hypothetical protein F4Y01_08215 [Gammaproteobacteria bacterium]|nr:hypothetical protein [Gammaproteobacteria bacterium]
MLRGKFGASTGQPLFQATISIPKLAVVRELSFVFDTGADGTTLMPTDAVAMGIDYGALSRGFQSVGVGGTATTYQEPALLAFLSEDGRTAYGYRFALSIVAPSRDAWGIPSLLGRDIIDRCRVTYDRSQSELTGEVVSCDLQGGVG